MYWVDSAGCLFRVPGRGFPVALWASEYLCSPCRRLCCDLSRQRRRYRAVCLPGCNLGFGHRVVPAGAPGVASGQPPQRQSGAARHAMLLNCTRGVVGARGLISARRRQIGGYRYLVQPDRYEGEALHCLPVEARSAASTGIVSICDSELRRDPQHRAFEL